MKRIIDKTLEQMSRHFGLAGAAMLVVKDGKIVEQGTHSQLLTLNGYYKELYTRQYEDEATAQILS